MFGFFGKKAKYPGLSWWVNFAGGHINIGKRITIFGENAMHWAIEIRTKRFGVIVFTLPVRTFGKYWGCHIYFSPNGTPWASTFYKSIWKENNKAEEVRAKIRKMNFGHNFNTDVNRARLRKLNDKFERFVISDYEINTKPILANEQA